MIYYMSATGNSLHAARKIAAALGEAAPVSMTAAGPNAVCDDDVIGFVFPVFAWGPPNMVEDFVASLKITNKGAYIFAIVTCGMSIGCCLTNIDALLKTKGGALSYGDKLRMVANYIPMYDVKTETADAILQKADVRLEEIIEDIKARRVNRLKKGMPWWRAMHKMSAQYKEADKDYSVSEACVGCGTCAKVCPARNIHLQDGHPTFTHNCEHCLACIHWCPNKAINYKNNTQTKRRYHHPEVKVEELV